MSSVPDWMLGSGLSSDMTGDYKPEAQDKYVRFWLPVGDKRNIIFLTEGNRTPVIFEHNVKLGGDWRNWFTCLNIDGKTFCPLCKYALENNGDFSRYKAMFLSVLDLTEFTTKTGEKKKNVKRLLCAKKKTVEILSRKYQVRIEEGQGLKGALYEVYRPNSDKSSSVGEDFEFKGMKDLLALAASGIDVEELDYSKYLAPCPDKMKPAYERLMAERSITTADTSVSF